MSTLAIVDYGMGNLRSVAKALEHVAPEGVCVEVTGDPARVRAADRVVFPGQGAAGDCMVELRARALSEAVIEAARTRPFLGICMGMQVLMAHSEENRGTDCLGLFAGRVRRFAEDMRDARNGERLKIPQMGWNGVHQERAHPLWAGIAQDERFYFVHSYYVAPDEADLTVATTEYGIRYTCAVARANVFAVQFHPEKSAAAGLQLLRNFARWDGNPGALS
ncbi:MAG: imidazole glycerol phosphate synthase subunit HisH [Halothiobacillaceae bacterium]|nr:imidazole glycerol phosphate synthase subunit HisH [Halothiobacillaceae bacterium]